MVRLAPLDFYRATSQMCRQNGVRRTRVMIKLRPCSRVVIIKSTDDRTTLTCRIKDVAELKVLEQVVNEYVAACMRAAPADVEASGAAKKKKAKKR